MTGAIQCHGWTTTIRANDNLLIEDMTEWFDALDAAHQWLRRTKITEAHVDHARRN